MPQGHLQDIPEAVDALFCIPLNRTRLSLHHRIAGMGWERQLWLPPEVPPPVIFALVVFCFLRV